MSSKNLKSSYFISLCNYKKISICFIIFSFSIFNQTLFAITKECRSLVSHLQLPVGLPDDIVLLESHLARLNAEVRRFDSRQEAKKLSYEERSEIKLEENILKANDEETLRELYLARVRFLIPKIVEKLADLYLKHHQREYAEAGIKAESTREELYSILLNTNLRDFSVDGLKEILKLKNLVLAQSRALDQTSTIRHHIQQLRMVISESNHEYAVTCLQRCISAEEARTIPKGKDKILRMAEDVEAKLIDQNKKTYSEMAVRNQKILDVLAHFPHFEHSFELSGFEAFVSEDPKSRAYLDALWPLAERFQKDRNRIFGCCGRMCGFNCPYLVGSNVSDQSTRVKTRAPLLAMYKAMKDFRRYVPEDTLGFPDNRSDFRRQLLDIRESDP